MAQKILTLSAGGILTEVNDAYQGTVTSVTAGNGLTQSGTSTINPTLDVVSHAGTAGSVGTLVVGADSVGVSLGTTSTTAYPGSNPTGFTTNAGTVTSVAALTLGTTGTDLSSTVAGGTGAAVITLQVPTASAANRGALAASDWTAFNSKQSTTASGIASVPNSSATTLFALSGTGIHTVMVHINNDSNVVDFAAHAVVIKSGTGNRIATNSNTAYMIISLSGENLQVTQNSGATQNIRYHYQFIA